MKFMESEQAQQYKQTIKTLSDRIVEAQRPLQILDAIKWDQSIEDAFFKSNFKELPPVDAAYYDSHPLAFDPQKKVQEFDEIASDVGKYLGRYSPLGNMMERICREYIDVVRMLELRGKEDFSRLSKKLYGSARDAFYAGQASLKDLADLLLKTLNASTSEFVNPVYTRDINAKDTVIQLQMLLDDYFRETDRAVRVKLDDGIVSDAAAGADYIKIREDAMFSRRDIRILEIHEGWVHLGTNLNGKRQPYCTFLGKGAPSSTITQEGLAIIMEIFCFASYPRRVRRLANRIEAVNLVEEGANFLDLFEFFRLQGLEESDCYNSAVRIFRGSLPTGQPFTKDLVYCKGFILIYNYIRLAVRRGSHQRILMLFCGKTTLEDVRTLESLVQEGLVEAPKFVPPQFADLAALTSWMSFSNFLNQLDLKRVETDYANIL